MSAQSLAAMRLRKMSPAELADPMAAQTLSKPFGLRLPEAAKLVSDERVRRVRG